MKKLLIILSIFILYMILFQNLLAQNADVLLGGNTGLVGFYIINSDNDTLFTCNGNGWVGIGTDRLDNILTVLARSGGDGISVVNTLGQSSILLSASSTMGFLELWGKDFESHLWERGAYITPWGSYYSDEDYEIGIGTNNPIANLHVDGNSGVLFEGTFDEGNIPTQGEGTRMMWYPAKAAFRAGYVSGDEWDDENIGLGSTAMGNSTTASGELSMAMGLDATASGDYSTAMGWKTIASDNYSTAMGGITKAYGNSSTAMGWATEASGDYSTAMGRSTIASNNYSTAMGYTTLASGFASTAMGIGSNAQGNYSTAIGSYASTTGSYSTAMGSNITASGPYSTAMGSYVHASGEGNFIIGDHSTTNTYTSYGTNNFGARFNNGYTLYTNSARNRGVFLIHNDNSWREVSDSTKKENFKLVDGERLLQKISNFKLGSWNFIGDDPTKYRHYGPMAQDFFAAFGHDGIGTCGNDTTISSGDFKGVNFIAIHALEKRTTELKKENELLKKEISELKNNLVRSEQLREEIAQLRIFITNTENAVHHKEDAVNQLKEISLNQ